MRINIIEDWKNAPKELKWFSLAIIPPFTGIFLLVYFWLFISSHFNVFFYEKVSSIMFQHDEKRYKKYEENMGMKKITEDNILLFIIAILVAIVCYLVFGANSIWTVLAVLDVKIITSTLHVIYEFITQKTHYRIKN